MAGDKVEGGGGGGGGALCVFPFSPPTFCGGEAGLGGGMGGGWGGLGGGGGGGALSGGGGGDVGGGVGGGGGRGWVPDRISLFSLDSFRSGTTALSGECWRTWEHWSDSEQGLPSLVGCQSNLGRRRRPGTKEQKRKPYKPGSSTVL